MLRHKTTKNQSDIRKKSCHSRIRDSKGENNKTPEQMDALIMTPSFCF
jgi:hypothetical protein